MMTSDNPLERAFELARSGEPADLRDLERQLSSEGYTNVQGHLAGPSLRKQLVGIINARRSTTDEPVA